jgi:hypothetical protein
MDTDITTTTLTVEELRQRGVVSSIPFPEGVNWSAWASRLSKITPMNRAFEGSDDDDDDDNDDKNGVGGGSRPYFRNILDEPGFPLDMILTGDIREALSQYFGIPPKQNAKAVLRLDDAFCVHYQFDQRDTTGTKHIDPSDITGTFFLIFLRARASACLDTTRTRTWETRLIYCSLHPIFQCRSADQSIQ